MMTQRTTNGGTTGKLLAGLAAASAALLLDPAGGARRRAVARDWIGKRGRQIGDFLGKAQRDARNRASGVLAETSGSLFEESVPDATLEQRVRSAIGRAVSNPHAIQVEVQSGCVTLRGPVLAHEAPALERAAARVRGVHAVESQLDVHATAGREPALQGRGRRRDGRAGLAPRTPTARLGTLAALGALGAGAVYALRGPQGTQGMLSGARRSLARLGASAQAGGRGARGETRTHHTVREVMTRDPVCCPPDATAAEAARLMKERHIGDVLVCSDGHLEGIVTDRDLVVRALADGERPQERRLGEICSHDIATVTPDDAIDRAVELMKRHAVRRLPVCEPDGRLAGVVSLGDLAVERDERSALGQISAAPPNA